MRVPRRTATKSATKPVEVKYLKLAATEGKSFLTPVQYTALVAQVKCLADWPNGPAMNTLSIASIDDFYELKEKGGIYGKINVRVYFGYLPKSRLVFILGAYKKEEEGKLSQHVVIRMRNRLRQLRIEYKE